MVLELLTAILLVVAMAAGAALVRTIGGSWVAALRSQELVRCLRHRDVSRIFHIFQLLSHSGKCKLDRLSRRPLSGISIFKD